MATRKNLKKTGKKRIKPKGGAKKRKTVRGGMWPFTNRDPDQTNHSSNKAMIEPTKNDPNDTSGRGVFSFFKMKKRESAKFHPKLISEYTQKDWNDASEYGKEEIFKMVVYALSYNYETFEEKLGELVLSIKDYKDKTGKTLLHYSVIHQQVGITSFLISNSFSLIESDNEGKLPIDYAISKCLNEYYQEKNFQILRNLSEVQPTKINIVSIIDLVIEHGFSRNLSLLTLKILIDDEKVENSSLTDEQQFILLCIIFNNGNIFEKYNGNSLEPGELSKTFELIEKCFEYFTINTNVLPTKEYTKTESHIHISAFETIIELPILHLIVNKYLETFTRNKNWEEKLKEKYNHTKKEIDDDENVKKNKLQLEYNIAQIQFLTKHDADFYLTDKDGKTVLDYIAESEIPDLNKITLVEKMTAQVDERLKHEVMRIYSIKNTISDSQKILRQKKLIVEEWFSDIKKVFEELKQAYKDSKGENTKETEILNEKYIRLKDRFRNNTEFRKKIKEYLNILDKPERSVKLEILKALDLVEKNSKKK